MKKQDAITIYDPSGRQLESRQADLYQLWQLAPQEPSSVLGDLHQQLADYLSVNVTEAKSLAREFYAEQSAQQLLGGGNQQAQEDIRASLKENELVKTTIKNVFETAKELGNDIMRHWKDFLAGTHPQSNRILYVAQDCKIPIETLKRDVKAFTEVVLLWREHYSSLTRRIRERDEKYLPAFQLFEDGNHPFQQVIKAAAEHLGEKLHLPDRFDRYSAFIRAAKDPRLLLHIAEGLGTENPQKTIARLESNVAAAESKVATLEKERASTREKLEATQQKTHEAEGTLSQRDAELSTAQSQIQDARRKLNAANLLIGNLEEELHDERSGERKRQEDLALLRSNVPKALTDFLKKQGRAAREDGGWRLAPNYGFLLAEARRQLEQNGDWHRQARVSNGDVFECATELLNTDDADLRFFHSEGQQLVGEVNSYLKGEKALSEVKKTTAQLDLPPEKMATPAVDSSEMVEAWLGPHRRFQKDVLSNYKGGKCEHRSVIQQYLRQRQQEYQLTPEAWKEAWDEAPWVFVLGRLD